MSNRSEVTRRGFLNGASAVGAAILLARSLVAYGYPSRYKAPVSAHLWVYASAYPPKWDSTPGLDRVFSDLSSAGFAGVEVMDVNLKHDDAVERIGTLINKYHLPVTGSSYGAAMWDKTKHQSILEEATVVLDRLSQLKGMTFGISVGDAKRVKTEEELDAQADMLKKVLNLCSDRRIEANLHNHTYEIVNDMHDLKGTLKRIPNIKLGPDFNWLIRGGQDPVQFIKRYGQQITYCHIRDQDANGIWTEYLGQGVTDFAAISKALQEANFRGRAAVELAFPAKFTPRYPLEEDWKRSRAYVEDTFGW